jgi:mono/diheme cytochrome c family protein
MGFRGAAGALFGASFAALAASAAQPKAAPDYEREVAPILREHCASCHGADKQENLLRLDSRGEALKGGMSGPVIVPGKSGESLLVQHLTGQAKPRMPHEKPPLAPELVATLAAWIDAGASGPDGAIATQTKAAPHWGFVAPVRPVVPGTAARGSNPIDAFVRERLAREGLSASARADRVTLLRRASLDLVGLPPTLAEIDGFLKDARPGAWERQVDRLLASPHYGERWARFWLDAARYADSDGFEKDKPRSVWVYRDWVVGALNRDLPYDRFVIEQVAGDLLPGATADDLAATGFLRNSMINEEGGIDPEQFRMEAMFDRMDAIGKGVLGLTIQCAQCHNHKFDPITQEEYYRLFAFLNDSHEGSRAFYTPDEQRRIAEILRGTREIEAELQHATPGWAERLAAWEESLRGAEPEWTVVRPEVEDISTDRCSSSATRPPSTA